jgi:hypothetical protein
MSESKKAEAERRAVLDDECLVDEKIARYEAEAAMDDQNPEFADFDLLCCWGVSDLLI